MERDKVLVDLGQRIRALRLSNKLTQVEFGALLGKDYQAVQRLEKGRINPTYFQLLQIAKGFDMSISQLLDF